MKSDQSASFLLLALLFLLSPAADSLDQFGDAKLTKMEIMGIVGEWCEADPWMVSLMTRFIACRVEYMVRVYLSSCLFMTDSDSHSLSLWI